MINMMKGNWKARIKQLGFWGFMFFLIKGLIWLAIGYFAVKQV